MSRSSYRRKVEPSPGTSTLSTEGRFFCVWKTSALVPDTVFIPCFITRSTEHLGVESWSSKARWTCFHQMRPQHVNSSSPGGHRARSLSPPAVVLNYHKPTLNSPQVISQGGLTGPCWVCFLSESWGPRTNAGLLRARLANSTGPCLEFANQG